MGVTQIVTVFSEEEGKEKLDRSLRLFPTKRIVFLARKERLREVVNLRNDFAIKYKLPTEIVLLEQNLKEIYDAIKVYEKDSSIVHIIDYDPLNYLLIPASFQAGMKVYFSNGSAIEEIPNRSDVMPEKKNYV